MLVSPSSTLAQIVDRAREPVVVRMNPEQFPQWVGQGLAVSKVEAWAWDGSSWSLIPYQIDEVSDEPQDLKPYYDPAFPGFACYDIDRWQDLPSSLGPCEFEYTLTGENPPAGELTKNDELVFLASSTGRCDAPSSSNPANMAGTRYRIQLEDTVGSSSETGCVYLFRRLSGTRPAMADLIDYDPSGDGTPQNCMPTSETCGAILAQADIDGDSTPDVPAYRWDFYGRWTVNNWQVGQTLSTLEPGFVDLIKWRTNPSEHEYLWDLYSPRSACGAFIGYIDGPVRVVRVIQSAHSAGLTRRYDYAYPGEVREVMYLRVHKMPGPIRTYVDVLKQAASPNGEGIVYTENYTTGDMIFDKITDAVSPASNLTADEWVQVATPIGSFLTFRNPWKTPTIGDIQGAYDDTSTPLWTDTLNPEWDSEPGDRAAARIHLSKINDSQSFEECVDPYKEKDDVNIFDYTYVMLSHEQATRTTGSSEMVRRDRGNLSVCVEEEPVSGGGGTPCIPKLDLIYAPNGGDVELSLEPPDPGCPLQVSWNLYRQTGAGVYKRLGSMGPSESFIDFSLALNESATYRASALGQGCVESALSQPVTVLHNDTVAPAPPTDVAATAGTGSITVTWTSSVDGDTDGYRVLVGESSGGPYVQVHQGLLDRLTDSHVFSAGSGSTYFIVVRAIDEAGNESVDSTEVQVTLP